MTYFREKVSGDKRRFVVGNYDLDLSYITPRVVAMAFPATGIEKIYRNSIDDVAKFIKERHDNHFRIINLSNRKYDYAKFGDRVEEYQWIDHHAPPLLTLFKVCQSMGNFLLEDEKNVCFVNCQAGKGRTGTIICCFLLYCGVFSEVDEVLFYYSCQRFKKGNGVTQPSQCRYINYFHQILRQNLSPPPIITIKAIYIQNPSEEVMNKFKPFVQFYSKNLDKLDYTNQDESVKQKITGVELDTPICITNNDFSYPISGDLTIKILNHGFIKNKTIGRVSFNTAFLDKEDESIVFHLSDIDPDNLVKDKKIPRSFQIIIKYKIEKSCENPNCSEDKLCENNKAKPEEEESNKEKLEKEENSKAKPEEEESNKAKPEEEESNKEKPEEKENIKAKPEEEESNKAKPEEEESNKEKPEEEESNKEKPEKEENSKAKSEEEESNKAKPEKEENSKAKSEEEESNKAKPEEEENIKAKPEEENSKAKSEEEENWNNILKIKKEWETSVETEKKKNLPFGQEKNNIEEIMASYRKKKEIEMLNGGLFSSNILSQNNEEIYDEEKFNQAGAHVSSGNEEEDELNTSGGCNII